MFNNIIRTCRNIVLSVYQENWHDLNTKCANNVTGRKEHRLDENQEMYTSTQIASPPTPETLRIIYDNISQMLQTNNRQTTDFR